MGLYKQEGVNPAGGCLPLLLQMPILIAFYNLLAHSIELRHAPFMLWITDLSAKDPYYVTPILMTATMWIQQQMTPTTGDPAMKRVQNIMPLVMGFLFKDVPSGLVLYWLMQNILTIAQQTLLNRFTDLGPASMKPARRRPEARGPGAESRRMSPLVRRPRPRKRRPRRPRDAAGRLGARGRPARRAPPGRALAVARRLAPDFPAEPPARDALLLRLVDAEGGPRSTAGSSSSGRPRARRPERRSWSSSATARRASSRASWRRRARAGARPRGARRVHAARARERKARPRRGGGARPRSRGREPRRRAARARPRARGRFRGASHAARERTLDALAALEAALDFAEDVPEEEGADGRLGPRRDRGGASRALARSARGDRREAGPSSRSSAGRTRGSRLSSTRSSDATARS